MAHKIYGQQVLFIEGDNPIVASTPEEMFALLTSDNVGKFVKYIGETGDFNFSTPTGRNLPVNPVTVDHSVDKWYFDTSVVPDFAQFAWSDLSSSETESIILCTVAVPGTTSGDKYILKVDRFPKGSRFADGWSRLKEDAYTIRIPFTSPSFKGYVYVSTEELAYQIKHTGANPPQVHQGWMVEQGTWNINDYGWWVTNVSQQDVWGGYVSKDGKWVAEVINTNLSLVKDAFYKISEEIDIARYIEVPILTNEGTAADLVSGKQLISSSGEVVTGTATIATENKLIQYADGTLTEITAEDLKDVSNISPYAFALCNKLTNVTIPDSVTTIGMYAFMQCPELSSITIGSGVTSIGDYAFYGCSKLTTVYYTGDVASWCKISGSGLESLMSNVTTLYINGQKVEGDLVIPDSVTSISSGAFNNCTGLTSVTIPNSVTSIGESAFYGCSGLTSITIGNGVTNIDYNAFYGCSKLTTVYYTGDVAGWCKISGSGLEDLMSNVTTLYINGQKVEGDLIIPDGVTSIGNYAFQNRTGLTSVTIGNSVTSIGNRAFYGCINLTSITGSADNTSTVVSQANPTSFAVIITSGTSIGYQAFQNRTGLTSVTIGNSVTSIGGWAFSGCSGLTSVTIPDSMTSIGDYAFNGCDKLTTVYYTGDVAGWCKISGSGLESLMSNVTTLYINGQKVEGDLIIPDGVTSIGEYAFQNRTGLTSVTIGNSVTSIGNRAFQGCINLTSITGSASNTSTVVSQAKPTSFAVIITSGTSIGDYAFEYCKGLTSVTIGNSVTSIGRLAFYECTGLTSITIPDSVTSIDDRAFYGCINLTSITGSAGNTSTVAEQANPTSFVVIITSGTSIGTYAFQNLTGLTSVTIGNSVTSIGTYAFYKCSSLTNVTIGNGVTGISDHAFEGCNGLTSVTIPDSVTSIGSFAFDGCTGLTSITIGNSVTSIGTHAFSECTGLTSITIPDSVTRIDNYPFDGCINLTSITGSARNTSIVASQTKPTSFAVIITSGTSIDNYAFLECTGLTSVTIPDSVTSIGDSAFQECSSLTSVTIPDSVTSIGESAFASCSGVTSVTIGNGVTSIGSSAFENCSVLTSVTIGNSVTSIGYQAFLNCYRLIEVYNKSTLSIIAGSSSNGYVAYYARNVYTNEGGSKLTTDENGYVIYTDGDEKILVTYTDTETELVLPVDITQINQYAFYKCTGLTSVTIGNSVTSIGHAAFEYCSGLTSVTIPDSVTSIGNWAFSYCRELTRITIGNSVTHIGGWAFDYCNKLKNIYITDIAAWCNISGLQNLMDYVAGNKNLYINNELATSITIPNGVKIIPSYAFSKCTRLTSVTIDNSVTSIGSSAFQGCSVLAGIILLPTTPPTLGSSAFDSISSSAVITVPKGTLDAYKAASGWSSYASKMVEAAN